MRLRAGAVLPVSVPLYFQDRGNRPRPFCISRSHQDLPALLSLADGDFGDFGTHPHAAELFNKVVGIFVYSSQKDGRSEFGHCFLRETGNSLASHLQGSITDRAS